MNIAAFILACIAIALFLAVYYYGVKAKPTKYIKTELALAVMWTSFVVQLVWETVHVVKFH